MSRTAGRDGPPALVRCTLPHAFGLYDWFEARFGDLCAQHDRDYAARINKKTADNKLISGMVLRGYPLLGFVTWLFLLTIGQFHYRRPI